ncbi:hypothetical protein ABE10_01600, partial [Bacillus toyonensis]|nr:hypothetical protein [Bacillus toyonensis]
RPGLDDARGIPIDQVVQEPLQVGGLRDVHRRAGGRERLRGGPRTVDPGAEELVEDVVLVGGQHEPTDRQSHPSGIVAGEDVAEVPGRDGE